MSRAAWDPAPASSMILSIVGVALAIHAPYPINLGGILVNSLLAVFGFAGFAAALAHLMR